ncbi:sodium channel protein Nach [Drosophila navojoa]|uniref:sodium channel protein Nach n=1 Tax=Drosophila navojoa TaxID=7232 RepID=UPI0011BDC7EC|nr:sodium channel protein Nach [Drosophila navojoa]
MILSFIKLYFDTCCIHGFRYLVKSVLILLERIFWLLLLIVSVYFCIISCISSVERFHTKSTHIGLERNSYYWNTSMPGLTICPMQRLNQSLFNNYCRANKIKGTDKTEFWDFLENLANSTYTNFENIPDYESIDHTLDLLGIKPKHYMELIYNLTFDGTYEPIEKLRIRCVDGQLHLKTRQILTEFGLCYLCSSYLGEEYSSRYLIFGEFPEFNKYLNKHRFVLVKKATFFDKDVGFNLMGFDTEAIDSYIHSAFEVMKVDNNFGYSLEGAAYEPEVEEIIAEPNFETETSISQRKCRFYHESNLTHYPFYTKNICQQECRINLAYKICKCIPHFYPNRIAKPKPVCTYKTLKSCFPRHAGYFLKFYEKNGHHEKPTECYCEQNCIDAVIKLKSALAMRGSKQLLGSMGSSVSMSTWPRNQFKRQVIFSFTDLLVSIGGTAGLYLGFSVLGLVEFIYFFTLRLVWQLLGYKL